MRDSFGRNITYMRISVTESCNMACRYCSPAGSAAENAVKEEAHAVNDRTEAAVGTAGQQLTSGQIAEVCKAAECIGIRSFRFTGGEPLLRRDLCDILSSVRGMPGTEDLTLTTNGLLLEKQIEGLVDAGLTGVNISLDTLNAERFREITGVDGLEQVKAGIRAALKFAGSRDDGECTAYSDLSGSESGSGTGLRIHLNCVPQEGTTEEDILALAGLTMEHPLSVRFIEMMPIGCGRKYRPVSNEKVFNTIRSHYPGMEKGSAHQGSGPAVYYRIPGAAGSIGFISPISDTYCATCNRIRLLSDGRVKGCLSYASDLSVLPAFAIVNEMERQKALTEILRQGVLSKPEAHTFAESFGATEGHTMQEIGG